MYYFWLGWGFLFVCIFLLLPLLLSELTLLKVNVACVPAENVLWKKSLFMPLLKISFKKLKKYNVFSCQSLHLSQLEQSFNPYAWKEVLGTCFLCCSLLKDHLGFQSGELQRNKWKGETCLWSTVLSEEDSVIFLTSLEFRLSSSPWILFQSLLLVQSGEISLF